VGRPKFRPPALERQNGDIVHPAVEYDEDFGVNEDMDEGEMFTYPITLYHANNIAELQDDLDGEGNVVKKEKSQRCLSVCRIKRCLCNRLVSKNKERCSMCDDACTIRFQGTILKKQRKGGSFEKQWYVLRSRELYSYKT